MGTTYAVDFVPVDGQGRSAPRSWRAIVGTERPESFYGFGTPVLAPCAGRVVIAAEPTGPFVLLAHLRRSSLVVSAGDDVELGQVIGQCGNSGNGAQPHVHLQATDNTDWEGARGLPC